MRKSSKRAYLAILLLGVVSLLGDIVYEGCRGITPTYLTYLGATAFLVGLICGFGELIGYAMRFVGGYLADTTKAYWAFTFLGYGLIISLPLLAFSNTWQIAALLIVLERLGKALRTPARDVILSVIGGKVGVGKTFGIHELMDQIGATLGPAFVAFLMLSTSNNYKLTFISLLIPFVALIIFLYLVYRKIGKETISSIRYFERGARKFENFPNGFYIYILAVSLNALALVTAPLILYRASFFFLAWMVPLIYLLIQAIDALAAILSGYFYDRYGIKILILPFLLSIIPSLLVFGNSLATIVLAAIVFGIIFGAQESIYRAAVADLVNVKARGRAYGLFNTSYGISMLLSGAIFGFFLDNKGMELVATIYIFLIQAIAILLLKFVIERGKNKFKMR